MAAFALMCLQPMRQQSIFMKNSGIQEWEMQSANAACSIFMRGD